MKSLTSLLTIPYDGLKALSYVFHYEKPADFEAPYAVWQETGESDFASNNRKSERALEGVIDFYTQTENDSKLDEIEGKLELMGPHHLSPANQPWGRQDFGCTTRLQGSFITGP